MIFVVIVFIYNKKLYIKSCPLAIVTVMNVSKYSLKLRLTLSNCTKRKMVLNK